MKKKRKGFTLTELIAVIVILALIVLVAIPAYNSIRKKTLEKQYNNLVTLIETTAEKFAAANGTNLTNVQELIDNGLLETDDGSKILDPRDGSEMNCFLIEITYEKGSYNSELTDKKQCNLAQAKLNYGTINIIIKGLVTGKEDYAFNEWINEDVELRIDRTNMSDDEVIESYRWVSGSGQSSNLATMATNVNSILNAMISVEVTTTSDRKYWASTTLKIDKEAPIIKDVEVSGGNNWNKGRVVKINATDQSGSGIAGYYLGTTPCNVSSTYVENSTFTIDSKYILDETDYYVCVKDKVGNRTEYDKVLTLSIKDKGNPTCNWIGESTSWINAKRIIELKCEDNESGCDPNYSGATYEYNTTTKTATIEQKIKDIAGNETLCKKEVDVYVDKTNPSAPTTMEFAYGDWSRYTQGDWANRNVYAGYTQSVKGPSGSNDNHSGVAKYQISSNGTTWYDYSYDKSKELYKMSTNGTHTRYFRAVDKAGNVSSTITRTAKIDITAPSIPTSDIRKTSSSGALLSDNTTSNSEKWYTHKVWWGSFNATDTGGSTIDHYEYSNNCSGTKTNNLNTTNGYTYDNGINYKFCIRAVDKAGNTSSWSSPYFFKVDTAEPTCGTAAGTSTTWTKSDRTIKQPCKDTGGSGCVKSSYNTTYDSGTTSTKTIAIKDNAGNSNTCTYNVYVDQTKPACGTVTNASTTWTKSDRTIKQACTDTGGSGCVKSSYNTTYDSGTTKTGSVTIADNVGNTRSCTYNVYVDQTNPTAPTTMEFVYGDWSRYTQGTWSSKNVYAAYTSSSKGPSGSTDTGGSGVAKYQISTDNSTWYDYNYDYTSSRYKMSSEGTHTRYFRAVDSVGNPSSSISRTAKLDLCTSPTSSTGSWSACAACGTSTQTRTITYTGISGKSCGSKNESKNCFIKACTPTVTITGNISGWICGSCSDNCTTAYRVTSGETCLKAKNGQYGNTMGKVTYTKSDNMVTFNWEIRQGAATWIGKSYWVKFIIKNSSSTIYTSYLKKADDAQWSKGSTHSGSLTYTFNSKGTYYIYIEGNSNSPNFDMDFGTITVS